MLKKNSMLSSFSTSSLISHASYLKKRFTLIELLVVVAIIAILAGMLLPALNSAKKTAQKVSCISNFKQLNMMDLHYAGNYKDWGMPYTVYGMYNGSMISRNWGDVITLNSGGVPKAIASFHGIRQFKDPFCPTGATGESSSVANLQYGGHNGGKAAINCCFHHGYYDGYTVKTNAYRFADLPLSRIKNASKLIHFGEAYKANDFASYWTSNTQFRHSRAMTSTFYDGHIEMFKKEQMSNANFYAQQSGNK